MTVYAVNAGKTWIPGILTLYKWQDSAATYTPDSPWYGIGRFGDGSRKTIYLAESARGAMAELFRRHAELFGLEGGDLNIRLYALEVEVVGPCLDVRDSAGQAAVGIEAERLTSSDQEDDVRYAECRQLADDTVAGGMIGIGYPSAAAQWQTWNVVLFDDQDTARWTCSAVAEVSTLPEVLPTEVNVLAAT